MEIDRENAEIIVSRISKMLRLSVNIMNRHGEIIASSDPTRIGTVHQAAKILVETQKSSFNIFEAELEHGVREGINVPIRVNNETIGVIGVTGNPHELKDVALVIGEMASIFFSDKENSAIPVQRQRMRRQFWETQIFQPQLMDRREAVAQAASSGIPYNELTYLLILQPKELMYVGDTKDSANQRIVRELFRSTQDQHFYVDHLALSNLLIIFTKNCDRASLGRLLQSAEEGIRMNPQLKLAEFRIGIGGKIGHRNSVSKAYYQAHQALSVLRYLNSKFYIFYQDLTMDLLYEGMDRRKAVLFLSNLCGSEDPEVIGEIISFAREYIAANGSLKTIAAEQFVHRNTVQYRIHKILKQTGYDLRSLRDIANFAIAVDLWDRFIQGDETSLADRY